MELKRQLFRQNLLRSKAFTQITLDDDCIVKDNKPDLLNIIHTRGSVIFEDVKVSSQTVWVTGQLRFVVLYRSEDNRLESFTDSINFGEKIFMDEVEERDTVNLSGDLEDLNISAINSRKLAVRALLGIHAVCEVPVEEEIVSGVENDPDIQQKSRTMQLLALTSAKKDILRVHSDIALPQSSPNIGHLLYDYVEVRNRQVICTGEQMQIQGEAYVNVLYSSPEGKMEWYETMVPFSESIEGGMTGTQPICWVHCQTKEYEVEPAEDYDGEMRALSLNLSMDVEMKLWEERNVELLADVYSLETNLVPQKEMVCAKKLLIKNEAKLRISEQMKLAEEQERILQLCSFEGHAEMDHVEPVENGLQVEGILTVDILYATTDDSFPIAHTQEQIPFTQIVDVPGMKGHTEDISYEIEPAIDQLALARFMQRGEFERHVNRLRTHARDVRDAFLATLKESLPQGSFTVAGHDAGLHFVLGFPEIDDVRFAESLAENSVRMPSLREFSMKKNDATNDCRYVVQYLQLSTTQAQAAALAIARAYASTH